MKLLKSNKSFLTGNKGQVALFVALSFQVLFLFFAMIINVGLLVNHKINLQNSVDMAAYYGASKQAELLNSIAHINYQMRQSWKLLSWRYRVLGSAGDDSLHPYDHRHGRIKPEMDIEYSNDPNGPDAALGNFLSPPFCITYNPFNERIVPKNESTCKRTLSPTIAQEIIRLFNPPSVVASFIGIASVTKAITKNMKDSALSRCEIMGPYNYMTIGSFMIGYQLDQYVRRVSISRISRSMSRQKNDFLDIEGNSVLAGAEETLKRNLTEANKGSTKLSFELYNSLAHNGCGNLPSDTETPAPWLSEVRVFPSIFYLDLEKCDDKNTSQVSYSPKNFDLVNTSNIDDINNKKSLPESYFTLLKTQPEIKERIKYIAQTLSLYNDKYRFVIGMEKNPWCQAYVGFKASANPKIPFAPSNLTLTASAFAKPFGGRIGPWYYKNWSKGSPESSGDIDDRTDTQLPLRVKDLATLKSDAKFFANPLRIANYSKYIGDPYGLTSWQTLAHMSKTLFNLYPETPYRTVNSASSPTDNVLINAGSYPAPRLEDWYNVGDGIDTNTKKDILAWNMGEDKESGMRVLEISGLAPDQFDLAYFSIEPNFYENYFKKLKDGLIKAIGLDESFIRPDLGARIGHPTLEKFSVKDQIKTVADISKPLLDFQSKLTYTVLNPVHLLTSWSNKSLFDYEEAADGFFGACQSPLTTKGTYTDPQENSAFLNKNESMPGECVTGGRTGYSVKIISKDILFSPIKAGGTGNVESIILNPPSDF
ncbi:MAG: Tad domain-containing protein [Deltaproteobacteria bacterium]|nr:Tad domain-containing protein [Deltaproteobacteria bacterium]